MDINLIKLKVKAKSLAEEARIIRAEENKLKQIPFQIRSREVKVYNNRIWLDPINDLNLHRVWNVRNEARATQLAIAFIKGKKYRKIEPKSDINFVQLYIKSRVVSMVTKYTTMYSDKILAQRHALISTDISNWFKE